MTFSCSKDNPSNTGEETIAANFTSNRQKIKIDENVTFQDLSKGEIISREWSFPGGNPATSTNQSPVVSYPNTGTFEVRLKVNQSVKKLLR